MELEYGTVEWQSIYFRYHCTDSPSTLGWLGLVVVVVAVDYNIYLQHAQTKIISFRLILVFVPCSQWIDGAVAVGGGDNNNRRLMEQEAEEATRK